MRLAQRLAHARGVQTRYADDDRSAANAQRSIGECHRRRGYANLKLCMRYGGAHQRQAKSKKAASCSAERTVVPETGKTSRTVCSGFRLASAAAQRF